MTASLDSFDPEAMEATVRGARVNHVQLAPGRFHGRLLHAELGGSSIDWGSYNLPLLVNGEMASDRVTLGFVFDLKTQGCLNGHKVSRATPVLLTEHAELHYRLPAFSQWIAFELPRERAAHGGLDLPHCHASPLAADPQRAENTTREIAAVLEVLRDISLGSPKIPNPTACMQHIEAHLLDLFSSTAMAFSESRSTSAGYPRERLRLVQKFTDHVHAHLDEPLQLGAICRDLSCDWRALERAFLTVNGVTPKRFLTQMRLSKARRMLLRPTRGVTVTSVAGDCGIGHLGRFSLEYRRMFGEKPSKTLARASERGSYALL